MTRNECKKVLKRYKIYKVEVANRTLDLEDALEYNDQEKIKLCQSRIDSSKEKVRAIETAIDSLDSREYLIIDAYMKCGDYGYRDLAAQNTNLNTVYTGHLFSKALDKIIPILEPVF